MENCSYGLVEYCLKCMKCGLLIFRAIVVIVPTFFRGRLPSRRIKLWSRKLPIFAEASPLTPLWKLYIGLALSQTLSWISEKGGERNGN